MQILYFVMPQKLNLFSLHERGWVRAAVGWWSSDVACRWVWRHVSPCRKMANCFLV